MSMIKTETKTTKSGKMPNHNACDANQLMNSAEGVSACTDGIDLFIDDYSTSAGAAKDNDMEDLQETLKTLSIGRTSPLRMRSVSPSPPGHCSLSPGPERRRANTFTAGQLHRPRIIKERGMTSYFSPPHSPRRLPRDPIQPSTGSISDLSDRHSSAGEGHDEDEGDDDHFSLNCASRHFRPRSRTCPENRAWRKKKLKVMNRPPTPPPSSTPTLGFMTSSLDALGSPNKSPLGGSRRSLRELPSFEEEDV